MDQARTTPDPLRWKALALLCTVDFMVILDSQIVILALPSIERDLGFSSGGSQWVISAYLLSFGGLLLLGGRLGDQLGRRRVFAVGTALFLLASLACGLASTPGVLVAARVVHGVSAALMAPNALAILMTTFAEGPERNKALAAWGGVGGLGATAALLVGGALTTALGWEWIFLINLPVAAVLLALTPVLLRESRDRGPARSYDPAGALSLTGALVLLIYAVVEAPEAGWGSGRTLGLLAGAVVLGAVFLAVERRGAAPLVPLGIFRARSLVGGNATMLLVGTVAWGTGVAGSLYAQDVLGFTPLQFGLGTMVMTLGAIAGSVAGQAMVERVGLAAVAAGGVLLLAAGSAWLTQVSAGGSYLADLFPGLLLFGPGLGATTVAASIAALAGIPEEVAGVASGTNTAAFQLGGALGSAIVATVVTSAANGSGPAPRAEGCRAGYEACVGLAVVALAATALLRPGASPGGRGRP